MIAELETITPAWQRIALLLRIPHSEEDYDGLVNVLNDLIDIVKQDEEHPLASLLETVGSLVEQFEEKHFPSFEAGPIETLRYLMEDRGMTQRDLREIGSQGVVSEILSGKRSLNLRQVRVLAKMFSVPADVFI